MAELNDIIKILPRNRYLCVTINLYFLCGGIISPDKKKPLNNLYILTHNHMN